MPEAGGVGQAEVQVGLGGVAVDEQHRAAAQIAVDVGLLRARGWCLRYGVVAAGVAVRGAVPFG